MNVVFAGFSTFGERKNTRNLFGNIQTKNRFVDEWTLHDKTSILSSFYLI